MRSLMKRTNGDGNAPVATFSGMVDRIFQDNLSRFFDDSFWNAGNLFQSTQVPVNIRESEKSYEMEIVVPGLKKEDLKINLDGDTLTISFEQNQQEKQESKEEEWLRSEYRRRSFSRSFQLDETIDPSKIAAEYKDGILHLQLTKKEGAQKISRIIEVK